MYRFKVLAALLMSLLFFGACKSEQSPSKRLADCAGNYGEFPYGGLFYTVTVLDDPHNLVVVGLPLALDERAMGLSDTFKDNGIDGSLDSEELKLLPNESLAVPVTDSRQKHFDEIVQGGIAALCPISQQRSR